MPSFSPLILQVLEASFHSLLITILESKTGNSHFEDQDVEVQQGDLLKVIPLRGSHTKPRAFLFHLRPVVEARFNFLPIPEGMGRRVRGEGQLLSSWGDRGMNRTPGVPG